MTSRDHEFPFDGDDFPLDIEALLRDFPERLNRLKRLSGLSWSGLSRVLGVDRKRCRRWADGTEPLRRFRALHIPLRQPDARRPGHPPGPAHRAGPPQR